MPAQIPIILSSEEKRQLEKNVKNRKTPVRLVERSKIVLLAAANMPNYKIAERLEIDVNKVGRWRNRFAEIGFAGIAKDLPRGANHGGKNSAKQATLRSKIIKKTTQEKPKDGTHSRSQDNGQCSPASYAQATIARPGGSWYVDRLKMLSCNASNAYRRLLDPNQSQPPRMRRCAHIAASRDEVSFLFYLEINDRQGGDLLPISIVPAIVAFAQLFQTERVAASFVA